MMKRIFTTLLATTVASSALAQAPATGVAPGGMYGDPAMIAAATAAAEAGGTGPMKAVMVAEANLPTHTLYRPRILPEGKLPVVLWGNGACANYGNRFRYFLTEIASHGYVAIAIGPIGPTFVEGNAALVPPGATPPPPADLRAPGSHASQLIDALNWAVAENQREGSPYRGKLDLDRVAVMGQSCGGVQALYVSPDPRIKTSVIWNSGAFPAPAYLAGAPATKDTLKLLHAPIAYISGDPSDIAFKNAEDDVDRIETVPVFRGWAKGIGHTGTYRSANGGEFSKVAVAWLDWQLKGSAEGKSWFVGKDCKLCTNPGWVVRKKKID